MRKLVEQRAELAAVLRAVDVFGMGAQHLDPGPVQLQREVVRDLPAHADDDAVGVLPFAEISTDSRLISSNTSLSQTS